MNKSALFLSGQSALVEHLFAEAGASTWSLTSEHFASALERSARKHFANEIPKKAELEQYLRALHLQDLALACACAERLAPAWEHFVATYRSYLRASAGAILRCSAAAPSACELADSLFAELYGLSDGAPSQRSLFRYFHGRSSLKTWLRAVLAQRHVDSIRAGRRLDGLDEGKEGVSHANEDSSRALRIDPPDPHRQRYIALFTRTLHVALALLELRDRERLRLYYAEGFTLAEIGRTLGEHESSVSRHLERIRRDLRNAVEAALRKGHASANGASAQAGLSEAEISLCFAYAAEDVPIDFDKLFPTQSPPQSKPGRSEP